jgi:hypothetical protein
MLKPPEQPSFPQVGINITPDGLVISTVLAPGTVITQMLNTEQVDAICQKWLETRKQRQDEMNIIQMVQRSKIK